MSNVPPGWYADTYQKGVLRYWDGNAWTESTHVIEQPPALPTAYPGASEPVQVKHSKVPVVTFFVAAIGLSLLAVAFHGSTPESGSQSSSSTAATTSRAYPIVKYEVYGSATQGDYTIGTATGTSQVHGDIPLTNTSGAHSLTYENFNYGDPLYISVQLSDEGSATCYITVDGHVISRNTSYGQYSIVTCSGVA
jgi:hypothetical protein